MIKYFSTAILLLVSFSIYAQEGTFSPYSFLGIGNDSFKGTAENRAMGGLSSAADSIHLNLQNPAAYGDLSYTALAASMTVNSLKTETNTLSESQTYTTFDYLAIGIPFNRFGVGAGIKPVTSVGYNIETIENEFSNQFEGKGGLNSVYFSVGTELFNNFKIGGSVNYNFGTLDYQNIVSQSQVQYATREIIKNEIRGFTFDLGVMKDFNISKNTYLRASASYQPEAELDATINRRLASVQLFTDNNVVVIDENNLPERTSTLTIPSKTSLGLGLGETRKWYIGADYVAKEASNFNNLDFNFDSDVSYNSSQTFKLGGYFTPRYNDPVRFYNRLTYRAGIRFEETGLNYRGEDINEFGITFGIGIPAGRVFTNANIGVEYFTRGTKNNNLIQENYLSVFLSFSFNDKWFIKSKFN
ncbi:lipid outer membrane transport protein FadL-like protein [Psychroflexus sp. ALD_RP9]|uniref:lipid outer membrane transport protein FadL-like protein n=1 Tax=Psychroflexus sp. ALD_RP9 TaxID=2777186 RepID=UPI001A8D6E96|nr:lipid outer membrane transport protein FadL-like protein [Psychroflexus sp. ALD_RP9]QSS98113.1 lipid outer membrane transport protein FadL-like protein [Psychroflexus sp. ALD_RP9]